MTQDIKNVIEKIKSNYDVEISSVEEQEDGTVYITIKDKLYTIYPAQNDQYYTDVVYYIAADANLYDTETKECTNVSDMGVIPVLESVESGKIYLYTYDENEPVEADTDKELHEISKHEPYCKVLNIYGNDRIAEVTFDIPENEDKDLPYTGEYSVFIKELTEVEEEKVSENVDIEVTDETETETKDQELTEIINSNPSLLVALDSEKDAKITYSTLIEIEESSVNPDQEVIALLKKILADELEHIALLSAQQAKQTSQFVAEDSQGEFESVINDIKEE